MRESELVLHAKELCRDLRKRGTNAEKIFWQAVRNRQFLGRKFYRQFPIFFDYYGKNSFFIADFYSHETKLVIEIDGKPHDYQKVYDEMRTIIINEMGIDVIRFKNEEIKKNLENVLKELGQHLTHPKSSTSRVVDLS